MARAVVALALLYLISPIDLIPNNIPVIGYADDMTLLWLGGMIARRLTPAGLLSEHPLMPSVEAQPIANEVWVLADDRIGNTNQTMGVAEKLGLPLRVHEVRYGELIRLPNLLRGESLIGLDLESAKSLHAPWPRLVIGTGRRVAPVSRFIKMMSEGRTKIVQIMDPEAGHEDFDLVVIPNHDRTYRTAANVLRTTGAPNRMTPERLRAEGVAWQDTVAHLPRPWVALLVGGHTRFFRFDEAMAEELGQRASAAARHLGGSLLITTSRRTGPETAEAVLGQVEAPALVHRWTPEAPNPFFGFLALADYVVVTGDSMSMCTEACTSEKPVYIYAPPEMTSAKYQRLHAELYDMALARPFNGQLSAGWQARMVNPTDQVAEAATKLLEI